MPARALSKRITDHFAELRREWLELDKAAEAIGFTPSQTIEPAVEPRRPTLTIKEAIIEVLESASEGMISQEILSAINSRFFKGRIERASFSPQLSRLKTEGRVVAPGTLYFRASGKEQGSNCPGAERSKGIGPVPRDELDLLSSGVEQQ